MRNRKAEIEATLKDLYISAYNNRIELAPATVYSYLIRRNVSPGDLNKIMNSDISDSNAFSDKDFFSRWCRNFENKNNIKVYCASYWKSFCQFENGNLRDNDTNDYVKVYIPLDYDHIYEGVNMIFNFLAESNIKHQSKVSSKIRFDDVVVRLSCLEDAKKLQAFIDKNPYLQEGMIKTNAFTFSQNKVAYAYDGNLSYNFYISTLIADYINKKIENSKLSLDDVNFDDFYSFVDMVSNDFDKIFSYLIDNKFNDLSVVNAYFIVQLLKKSLVSNDFKEYEEFYKSVCNINIKNDVLYQYKRKDINPKEKLFQEMILTMMKKYPLGCDEEYKNISGYDYIISFLKNGNINAITRDNNLRNRVSENLNLGDIAKIVGADSVNDFLFLIKADCYIKMTMLNNIISSMKMKFPNDYVARLKMFLSSNDSLYITRNGGARQLAKTFQANYIRNFFLQLEGVKGIDDYIFKYYNKNNAIVRGAR